jgi:division protein CdvB (Snf7/Vps24/ESCRT-III family)
MNMEELLHKIMLKLETMDTRLKAVDTRLESMDTRLENVETKIDGIQLTLDSHHLENIESDNRLLEAIHTTNDRLDFQRDKISKTEEDLYLLKQKH